MTKRYTWKELCDLSEMDMVDLTGAEDWAESVSLEDTASGTVLGDEIIAEMAERGLL